MAGLTMTGRQVPVAHADSKVLSGTKSVETMPKKDTFPLVGGSVS